MWKWQRETPSMSWLTHRRSWRSDFVCCLAAGCSMARAAVARFRQRRLVFRLRPPLLHQLDQIAQRHRPHRFELACGALNKGLAWNHQVVVDDACMTQNLNPPTEALSKALANSGVSVGSLRRVRLALLPFEELLEQLLFFPID